MLRRCRVGRGCSAAPSVTAGCTRAAAPIVSRSKPRRRRPAQARRARLGGVCRGAGDPPSCRHARGPLARRRPRRRRAHPRSLPLSLLPVLLPPLNPLPTRLFSSEFRFNINTTSLTNNWTAQLRGSAWKGGRTGRGAGLLRPAAGDAPGGGGGARMPPDPPAHGGERSCRAALQGAGPGAGVNAEAPDAGPGGAQAHMRGKQPQQVRAGPCRCVVPSACRASCALRRVALLRRCAAAALARSGRPGGGLRRAGASC